MDVIRHPSFFNEISGQKGKGGQSSRVDEGKCAVV